MESTAQRMRVAALKLRDWSSGTSAKWRAAWETLNPLADRLGRDGIVGIADIDTRGLIQHIRDCGAMNALISNDGTPEPALLSRLKDTPSMEGLELIQWGDAPSSRGRR